MPRTERLVIKLNKAERTAIDRLARAEYLPTSTLARKVLLIEARRYGLWPAQEGKDEAKVEQVSD